MDIIHRFQFDVAQILSISWIRHMDNWQDRSVLLTLLSASGIQGYPQRVIYLVDLKPFGTILKFPPVGVSVSKNIGWKHTFCLPSFYCIFCALDDSFVLFRFNFVPLMLFAPLCHGQCSPRVPLLVSSFANQPPIIHFPPPLSSEFPYKFELDLENCHVQTTGAKWQVFWLARSPPPPARCWKCKIFKIQVEAGLPTKLRKIWQIPS